MLIIRPEQEYVFVTLAIQRLEERICQLLLDVFPERCAALSAEQLHAAVARRTELGLRAGLANEDELARLNVFLFAATQSSAQDSEPAWATDILEDPAFDANGRLALMRNHTHTELG